MATLFSDDFNRANGAIGNSWGNVDTWTIATNTVHPNATGVVWTFHAGGGSSGEMGVEVTARSGSTLRNARQIAVTARVATDRTSYYLLQCIMVQTTQCYLVIQRFASTVYTSLATSLNQPWAATDHTIRLETYGSRIRGYFDGRLILDISDEVVAAGPNCGMMVDSQVAADWQIDNFLQTDVSTLQMLASPSIVPSGGYSVSVAVGRPGADWTVGIPGEPEFTITDGTIDYQRVFSSIVAIFTLTTPMSTGYFSIVDPTDGAEAHFYARAGEPDPGGGWDVYPWLVQELINRLAGMDIILTQLGQQADRWYLNSIIDELGVSGGETPSEGRIKPMALSVIEVLRQLNEYTTEPNITVRSMVAAVLADTDAFEGQVDTLQSSLDQISTNDTRSIDDALTALGNLQTQVTAAQFSLNLISTNDDVTIADARNDISLLAVDVGVVAADLAIAQADLDAIRTGGDYTLGTVGNWLLGIGSLQAVTLAAVIASVLGRGTATALQVVDVVTDVVAEGTDLEGIVTVLLTWLGNMQQPTLPTISIDLTTAIQAIGGVHDDLGLDVAALTDAISGHDTDIKSQLDAIEGKLDDLIAGGLGGGATPPAWPGIELVTLGSSVPITQDMSITGPLDGILWEITGFAQAPPAYTIGDRTSYSKLGIAAFVTDEGDAERFQTVSFDAGIIIPQSILRPAACVIHWRVGVQGNVVPWTVT